jgi:hypothetical protein
VIVTKVIKVNWYKIRGVVTDLFVMIILLTCRLKDKKTKLVKYVKTFTRTALITTVVHVTWIATVLSIYRMILVCVYLSKRLQIDAAVKVILNSSLIYFFKLNSSHYKHINIFWTLFNKFCQIAQSNSTNFNMHEHWLTQRTVNI